MKKIVFVLIFLASWSQSEAQTTGPTQPEAAGFAPIGAEDMVDLYSGDFNYNIPLMVIPGPDGGYPINMFYNSNVGMDQNPSWVGLGWNLNAGAIQRNLRGTPDDFKGDEIIKEFYTKPSTTIKFNINQSFLSYELLGLDISQRTVNKGFSVYYNNYSGLGINTSIGTNLNFYCDSYDDDGFSAGLGLTFGSQEGFTLTPSLSYDWNNTKREGEYSEGKHKTLAIGAGINSKQGFSDLNTSFSSSIKRSGRKNYVLENAINESNSWYSTVSFASSSPLSTISTSRFSTNADFSFTIELGKESFPKDKEKRTIGGSLSHSWVTGQKKQTSAFGAMYMAYRKENSISDFYRENAGPITKDNVITPIPVLTYDVFSIQGHGVGGSFRAYQNSIGKLSDAKNNSTSVSVGLGIEVGLGPGMGKAGFDAHGSIAGSNSGRWKDPDFYYNELKDYKFNSDTISKPLFEPFYFKMIGEASALDTGVWDEFQAEDPIAFDINLRWDWNILAAKAQAHSSYNRSGKVFNGKENESRNPRTQSIEYFTKKDIDGTYTTSHIVNQNKTKLIPIDFDKGQGHHLNGISILKPNGVRYNYFLPAYNDSTEKVTFAIPDRPKRYNNNLVGENPKVIDQVGGRDVLEYAKINNGAGEDEFYSKETIPAYAHTFFITSILSQDYVDIKNDGPTDDDLGTFIKMNYEKVTDYEWRFPFKGAYYSKGYLDNLEDDKASYQRGKKDLFYVKSIETKTHVAVFETIDSELVDASETLPQKQLVSITLYSKADPKWKPEFYLNQPISNWPTPIQTVHLNQEYSLKKGIPNTISGMAPALKELYFTYQNSTRGENAKYQFDYGFNPDYAEHEQDRWGAYQPDLTNRGPGKPDILVNENPYTYQDENYGTRKSEASAWLLNKITLPSKGTIEIDFEKDDYSYVQDRKATSFIELLGTGKSSSDVIRTQMKHDDSYLFFKSPYPLSNKSDVEKMIEGMDQLRFRVYMQLKYSDKAYTMAYDYVEGYAEIDHSEYGIYQNDASGYTGYVKILSKPPKKLSPDLHPFRLAAFQYIRKSRPDLGLDFGDLSNIHPVVFGTRNLLAMLNEASVLATGYYKTALIKGWAPEMSLDKPSYIRLINPIRKYGGGSRVKSVKLKSDEPNAREFGQTYHYTLSDGRSSGVAEWEPILGIEENPFTQPIWLNANNDGQKIIFSNEQSFSEEPLGAGLYPSATVGYSRVTVRNLENDSVTLAQSGINITEFYTAQDFPTKADRSGALFAPYWAPIPIPFIGEQNTRYNGYSMGYSFTLNNGIYGRQKSVATYPYTIGQPTSEPIQKSVYKYKTNPNDSKALDNKVTTLLSEGIKKEVFMGREIDFYIDEIEANTFSIGLGSQFNTTVQANPPLILPSWFPKINTGRKGTRYLTTNKIIYNTPILESITQYKDGAKVTTENLLFDHETGEPIITSVTNEWKKPIYTYNFPAHWTYDEMKGASKNYRSKIKLRKTSPIGAAATTYALVDNNNAFLSLNVEDVFIDGDLIKTELNGEYYVSLNLNINQIELRKRDNSYAQFSTNSGIIIQSGYKNLQSTKKGKIISLEDPTSFSNITSNKFIGFANSYNNIRNINSNDISNTTDTKRLIQISNYFPNKCEDRNERVTWRYDDYYVPAYTIPPYQTPEKYNNLDLSVGIDGCEFSIINHNVPNGFDYSNIDIKKFKFLPNSYDSTLNTIELKYDDNTNSLRNYSFKINLNSFDKCLLCEERKPITILHADATEFSEDWNFNYKELKSEDTDLTSSLSEIANDQTLGNPYAFGIKGIWRPKRTSAYLIDRKQSGTNGDQLRINLDGEYKEFYWFDWTRPISYNENYNWRWVNEVTKYNINGASKEGRNRLDIHAASLFGYNNHLVTASASNSKTSDIAFDGFEDYGGLEPLQPATLPSGPIYRDLNHGNLNIPLQNNSLIGGIAHTGEWALIIENPQVINVSNPNYFNPTQKKYTISAWVYMGSLKILNSEILLVGGEIGIFENANLLNTIKPNVVESNIIDGWMKIEGHFTPTIANSTIEIKLIPKQTSKGTLGSLFDDIRIQPFNSGMETYVYDPTNYRLKATLSNQNFATFYNYDEEGNLTQTKVETERGIKTISSNRNNIKQ